MSDAGYFRHLLEYDTGFIQVQQHIKAVTPWQALIYDPAVDPPEALRVALRSFNRGIGVRSIYYAWRRIAKWLRDRVHYKRVQRYLVDIGISQLGDPRRGLLKYTFLSPLF